MSKADNTASNLLQRLKEIFIYFTNQQIIESPIEEILPLFYILIKFGENMDNLFGLIATCCAAEIVRNFTNDNLNLEFVDASYVSILYSNYAKHIIDIKYKDNNYVWKFHLLRILSDIHLLNLDLFPLFAIKTELKKNIFIILIRTLYDIGATWDNIDHFGILLTNNFQQLIKSAIGIRSDIVIKEIFTPIIKNKQHSIQHFVKKNLKHLMLIHYNYVISLFYKKMEFPDQQIFEDNDFKIFYVILKEIDLKILPSHFLNLIFEKLKNNYFKYYVNIVELLAIYIYKYSKENQNNIINNMENAKKYKILFNKFYKSMVRKDFQYYNHILIMYGNHLIKYSPSEQYKFGYLNIIFNYIKKMTEKNFDYIKLIEMFESNNGLLKATKKKRKYDECKQQIFF